MVKKEVALQVQRRGLNAIIELMSILDEVKDHCGDEDFDVIKRGVGLSVGRIQTALLDPIYKQHPEIDDLR